MWMDSLNHGAQVMSSGLCPIQSPEAAEVEGGKQVGWGGQEGGQGRRQVAGEEEGEGGFATVLSHPS